MFGEMDWIAAVKDVGFPIVAYGALAAAVWQVIRWIGGEIFIPIRNAFTGFLGSVRGNLDSQTGALNKIANIQDDIKRSLDVIATEGCGVHATCKPQHITKSIQDRSANGTQS